MKERQLDKKFVQDVMGLLMVPFIVGTFAIYGIYHDRKLKDKCTAEQIIDELGNPGQNFNLEAIDPCDKFITISDIQRVKEKMRRDRYSFPGSGLLPGGR